MTTIETLLQNDRKNSIKKLQIQSIGANFEEILDILPQLTSLEQLEFGSAPIYQRHISKISDAKSVQSLTIENYRSGKFPTELRSLNKLTTLHISGPFEDLPFDLHEWPLLYLDIQNSRSLEAIHSLPANLDYLNISNTRIAQIPEAVFQLKKIKKIVAGNLGLTYIQSDLFKIPSLESLFLQANKLISIPDEISHLKNLVELSVPNNAIIEFPKTIVSLTNLKYLNLAHNNITSIPSDIQSLRNLIEINLNGNHLTNFPKSLLGLTNIQRISLSDNYIKDKYGNERYNTIFRIPEEIVNSKSLKTLRLDNLYVENVPQEITKTGWDSIKNFLLSKKEADLEKYLFEAKMVLVGRGNVGKTVLSKKLLSPGYKLDRSDTTRGINILRKPFLLQWSKSQEPFKLNIWDFGGQEKYDATHQLFITKRSIYLFLTEAREESNYLDFYYWLNTIQLFSDSSPVIIVLSKCDERKKTLAKSLYKEQFKNIVDFIDVSCAPGFEGTIKNLKNAILEAIKILPQTKLKLSNKWINIRSDIENLSNEKDFIPYSDYLEICEKHGLNKTKADFLSQYLNDLGVIIHHQFDLLLKQTIFINTDWCVDGMYKVLDSESIINGKFTINSLDEIWNEPRFSSKKPELLKLMHQYQLCFELRDNSGYIAPDLLPPDKPSNLKWDHTSNLRFEFRYDFMPAGILGRFIVKSHSFVKSNMYWKHGVVLEYENTLALIIEDSIRGKITISVSGEDKKGLLSAVRMNIIEIHKDFDKANKLSFEEMVPCNCDTCINSETPHFYKFDFLKKLDERGKDTVQCEKSIDDVLLHPLLTDVQLSIRDRRISTNRQLKDFILDILTNNIEKEILLKSSFVNFWRDTKCTIPKNETEIQPYISNSLDIHCKTKGIQLSREVREAEGSVDILLTTKNEDDEILKVCIEIKKAHHANIETAIETQLPLYMESVGTDAAIYLVIWLKNKHQNLPEKYTTKEQLKEEIQRHKRSSLDISVKILDCCKPISPSKN
ncbi:COR domain-containing protein [Chryseolinea lacunae]|uniref:Leucine-rich repeat domain-containing protein n=1 Tax=Chryseolinea lacunae TaxID=2801331 RepID=A0ABS1L1W9_9BACT|nr:COR domain-containing protein [Chryseolinea lacunae]MBL0745523.1 leucine-rich repeat domain-containing protein [Chryseolinea lacunae]